MKVVIIIATHNGARWIHKCLDSVVESTLPITSIVIDNGSIDNTPNIIRNEFPQVELVETAENLGFGQANNIGIKKAYDAGADYVFLLNQDAWVEPNTIETLLKLGEKHPNYGIISPLHLNGKGDKLDWNFSNFITPRHCPELYSNALLNKPMSSLYQAEFVNAAAWLIPRKTIEKVGGFSPLFFHYGEDRDYVNRLKYHGLKVGVSPGSKIFHDREYRDDSYKNRVIKETLQLVKWADINSEFPINTIISKQRNKFIKLALQFRINELINSWKAHNVFLGRRRKIEEIRITAIQGGLVFL